MAEMTLEQALDFGLKQQRSGNLQKAESVYREILTQRPRQPDALFLLGTIADQVGKLPEAEDFLRQAIAADGRWPHFHVGLGAVLRTRGKLEEAAECFRQAIALAPGTAQAHVELSGVLERLGKSDEAAAARAKAIEVGGHLAEVHVGLGFALQQAGCHEQAAESYRRAIELKPDNVEAYNDLAVALQNTGKLDEAIETYRKAMQLAPGFVAAISNLAGALAMRGLYDEAIEMCRKAAAMQPNMPGIYGNFGQALLHQGRVDEAIDVYRKLLSLKPDWKEASAALLFAMQMSPWHGPRVILEEHLKWADKYAKPLAGEIKAHENDRSPERRLKVGYVSSDFRDHPVARFMEPLLAGHDRGQFEVICYSDVKKTDELTAQLRGHTDVWRETQGMDSAAVAEMVRNDKIDILVDLGVHTQGSRMEVFARKPAPVQVTYLGYAGTTGLATIDYRLTDRNLDPPGVPYQGTEEAWHLPGCYWCYPAPADAPEVAPLPVKQKGHVTFGSFNSLMKVNKQVIAAWSRILKDVPDSRIIVIAGGGEAGNKYVKQAFEKHGIDGSRVEVRDRAERQAYFQMYGEVDICLDPFPYGGATTSLDGMWMGVPIVTLAGNRPVSRAGVTLLKTIGLPELIATTQDEYVKLAVDLARDTRRLEELRNGLRQKVRQSSLVDGKAFIKGLEEAYRSMWRKWCEK